MFASMFASAREGVCRRLAPTYAPSLRTSLGRLTGSTPQPTAGPITPRAFSVERDVPGDARTGPISPAEHHAEEGSTYTEMKEAARRTGDAAREWMEGASTTGSTVYKQTASSADDMYTSTKRALEETAGHSPGESLSKSAARGKADLDEQEEVLRRKKEAAAAAQLVETKENAQSLVGAVAAGVAAAKGGVGEGESVGEGKGVQSARATWAETRPEEVKREEAKSQKSQLTDEAAGDNPVQAVPREERRTGPNEMYTRH